MPRLARELMQRDVLTLSPEASLLDAHRLFVESEISGAPVVGDDGAVMGVLTALDLLRTVSDEHESGRAHGVYFRDSMEFSSPDWSRDVEDFQDRLAGLTVSEVMTREIVGVEETAPIAEAAGIMRGQRVHRVLVLREGRLVGILTTFDLVALLEKA